MAETGLTCITCRLAFSNGELQRDHYRSDWHRYNVKRQLASLPPISIDDFKTKEGIYGEAKKDAPFAPEGDHHCRACQKSYKSVNAFDNHAKSKRHRENLALLNTMEEEMTTGLEIRPRKEPSKRAVVAASGETSLREGEDEDGNMDSASTSSSDWETIGPEDEDYEGMGAEGVEDPAFLVLPSGATIGHRSLFRYFRQFLKPIDKVQPKKEKRWSISDRKLKSLGWTGTIDRPEANQIARDVKFLQKTMAKYQRRMEAKSNKLFKTRGRKDQQ